MTGHTQAEALRLAAWLNEGAWHQMRPRDVEAAGRELRRLHAENEQLRAQLAAQVQELAPLTVERIRQLDDETHLHEAHDWSVRFARRVEAELKRKPTP